MDRILSPYPKDNTRSASSITSVCTHDKSKLFAVVCATRLPGVAIGISGYHVIMFVVLTYFAH
jgi:hypothetical protein